MNRQNLEFTIREFPEFISSRNVLYSYPSILLALRDCHNKWPELVAKPRPLVKSKGGRWVYIVTIGHGNLHTIIEVMPHGGEPFWLQGCLDYVRFMCERPWLLADRTIHLLLAGPDEAVLNFEGWGRTLDIGNAYLRDATVFTSLGLNYRHPRLTENHCWSYPLSDDTSEASFDVLAGMMLVEELAIANVNNAEVLLVLWVAGHNEHVAWGTLFQVDGPGAARSGRSAERVARRLRVPLNTGPAEEAVMRRHPGTVASWTFPTAEEILELYPDVEMGCSGPEWAKRNFPELCANLCVQSSEVAMLLPRDRPTWRGMTVAEARAEAGRAMMRLKDDLLPLVELAYLLPEDDPFVSAARALKGLDCGGFGRLSSDLPDNHRLTPSEAFYLSCARPLYLARAHAPAVTMVYENLELARQVWTADGDPLQLAGTLRAGIATVGWHWWLDLRLQPIREAITLQILAAEIAFYGVLGIRPRFCSR